MKHAIKLLKHQIDLNQKTLLQEKKFKFSQELWEIMEARKVYIKDLKEALEVLKQRQSQNEFWDSARKSYTKSYPEGRPVVLIDRAFQTAGPRKTRKPNLPRA